MCTCLHTSMSCCVSKEVQEDGFAYIYVMLCFQRGARGWVCIHLCHVVFPKRCEMMGLREGMILQLFEATINLFDHFGCH
jgi:hypothetical protein